MFWFQKKKKLKAVYEDDLVQYLKSTGLYSRIILGELKCRFCGKKITLSNLEIIFPTKKGIKIICNNKNCLNQM